MVADVLLPRPEGPYSTTMPGRCEGRLIAPLSAPKVSPTLASGAFPGRLTKENAEELIGTYDLVVDGCDNFATRYLINDVCVKLGKPYVYGAICGFEGQVSVFNHNSDKTYRDLFPDEELMLKMPPPPKGVIGMTPGVTGCVQAMEAVKIICGLGEVMAGKLWTIDIRTLQTNIFSL